MKIDKLLDFMKEQHELFLKHDLSLADQVQVIDMLIKYRKQILSTNKSFKKFTTP